MKKEKKGSGAYVQKVAENTQQYLRELVTENERLRAQLASLKPGPGSREEYAKLERALSAREEELSRAQDSLRSAQRQLEAWERREADLRRHLTEVEGENRHYSDRFVALEREAAKLSSLYVASYRLHETLDRQTVLKVIEEIVAAIIGSEELAIFEMNAERTALRLVTSIGVEASRLRTVPLGEGRIGRAARLGETYVAQPGTEAETAPLDAGLTACVPLKLGGAVTGAIAIFRLLPQKSGYEAVDYELFELLGAHAATAMYCTRLYAQAMA